MNNNDLNPVYGTHPGKLIKDELKKRRITQKMFAEQTGINPTVISGTICGRRAISLKMAQALEKALGIHADVWMNLQAQYDLDTPNIAKRGNQRETVLITIPVRDRILLRELARKFGWLCVL